MTYAKRWGLRLAGVVTLAVAAACGDDAASGFLGDTTRSPKAGANDPRGEGAGGTASSPTAPGKATDLTVIDNGVIVVHAAGTGSFRLCFRNELKRKPTPDSELMPQANVVGVEVGSAIRLPPLAGPPGEVYLFGEELLRGNDSSCEALLNAPSPALTPVPIGTIDADLAHGVHVLAVEGCQAHTLTLTQYDKARCGKDYDPTKGNLHVREQLLTGQRRDDLRQLPAQVMNLSQGLDSFRGNRGFSVSFGKLGAAVHVSKADSPAFAGQPSTLLGVPSFDPDDPAVYSNTGFRVSVDGAGTVAEQSLAEIQVLSSPRDIPPSYYAAASNYVLLLLGTPTVLADGGATDAGDDGTTRRRLHFLAVPVVEPKSPDAGAADAGDAGPF